MAARRERAVGGAGNPTPPSSGVRLIPGILSTVRYAARLFEIPPTPRRGHLSMVVLIPSPLPSSGVRLSREGGGASIPRHRPDFGLGVVSPLAPLFGGALGRDGRVVLVWA